MNKRVFIIAEVGVNHNGSIEIAFDLIDAATEAGADAVKFQTFKAEEVATLQTPKAPYQIESTDSSESHLEMIKKYEFGEEEHRLLFEHCKKKKIMFLSSPFDEISVSLLDKMGLEILKIPSGEITNLPYLRKIGKLNKNIILSTGMANLMEVEEALDVLVSSGTVKENITVLHCNSAYPTPFEDVNLQAMVTLRDRLNIKVGYSDHTMGIEVAIAAAAMGAVVIEKHITLDRNMEGPDHKVSLEPPKLKTLVDAIRIIEKSIGNGVKKPTNSELKNIHVIRKSIVAATAIKKGTILTNKNITTKRPALGINPMQWDEVIGRKASKDFKKDELINI